VKQSGDEGSPRGLSRLMNKHDKIQNESYILYFLKNAEKNILL